MISRWNIGDQQSRLDVRNPIIFLFQKKDGKLPGCAIVACFLLPTFESSHRIVVPRQP